MERIKQVCTVAGAGLVVAAMLLLPAVHHHDLAFVGTCPAEAHCGHAKVPAEPDSEDPPGHSEESCVICLFSKLAYDAPVGDTVTCDCLHVTDSLFPAYTVKLNRSNYLAKTPRGPPAAV
jgi:hypothetical protein